MTKENEKKGIEQLVFMLAKEEYAVNILNVQEIRDYNAVTRIANAPDFIKGVINLRGVIVPIIDMRIRFGFDAPTYDEFTVVIILDIAGRTLGMVVDSVSDVITLSADQIMPPPELGSTMDADHLTGLASVGDRMLILLDIVSLMSSDEVGILEKAAA